ncbi:MAG: DUF1292 domain-containing protein [Clostridia bacterium]|nr:DUF1292 domain-containing protein [Clostridia bacterium]
MNPLDMLLDESCNDNIVLYDDDGEPIEFEQIALIPIEETLYFILRPIEMEGLEEDEAFVFQLIETDEDSTIDLVEDDEIVEKVFELYYSLLDDEE